MGSDLWTDEVRGFYFEISPAEFPKLLNGRNFELRDLQTTYDVSTTHIKPPISFSARWRYVWETDGAGCTINATESKDRVIVLFYAD